MGTRLARQQSGAALALAAALFVTAALRPCVAQQEADCPPEGFDSIEPFNVTAWTDHPWYIQEQMPVLYQVRLVLLVRHRCLLRGPGEQINSLLNSHSRSPPVLGF